MKSEITQAFNDAHFLEQVDPEMYSQIKTSITEKAVKDGNLQDYSYGFLRGAIQVSLDQQQITVQTFNKLENKLSVMNEQAKNDMEDIGNQDNHEKKNNEVSSQLPQESKNHTHKRGI